MNREAMRARLDAAREPWDVLVIGGGATGLGCALEAASRGLRTALVEQRDFASGTSSRSTKLFHGGVRYLRGGQIQMVAQSLREREHARQRARELVRDTAFLVPVHSGFERFYYASGLRLYDWLARGYGAPRSHTVSPKRALELVPTLKANGLRGGVIYHDLQFDDARFAVELACAAAARGAVVLNHAPVEQLLVAKGRVMGAAVRDLDRGDTFEVSARRVVNAAGVFADSVRRLARPQADAMLRFSRGAHIVLEREFLPGDTAVLVPRTDDDRVVFLIPWRGRVLVGTTDTPVESPVHDPFATQNDIDYLLEHASRYLSRSPSRPDVRSAFAGLRPLPAVKGRTANVRRDHRLEAADGLVTITGGKWTTYGLMARDAIDATGLAARSAVPAGPATLSAPPPENARLEARIFSGDSLDDGDRNEVARLARDEMALSIEDVLARRTRVLFLDAKRASDAAPWVADELARVLGRDAGWIAEQVAAFTSLAAKYLPE